jgi:hypothetical protein
VVTARRLRGDAGQVAGIEAIPFGLLVLTVGVLLVAHTWAVVDAKFVTTAAAREAARAYVEAPLPGVAEASAMEAAGAVVERSGRDPGTLHLDRLSRGFGRCVPTRFEAVLEVPTVATPWRGDRPAHSVRADHSEVVDPYRNGLPGLATCAVGP